MIAIYGLRARENTTGFDRETRCDMGLARSRLASGADPCPAQALPFIGTEHIWKGLAAHFTYFNRPNFSACRGNHTLFVFNAPTKAAFRIASRRFLAKAHHIACDRKASGTRRTGEQNAKDHKTEKINERFHTLTPKFTASPVLKASLCDGRLRCNELFSGCALCLAVVAA
jgi:hypothetical protein